MGQFNGHLMHEVVGSSFAYLLVPQPLGRCKEASLIIARTEMVRKLSPEEGVSLEFGNISPVKHR